MREEVKRLKPLDATLRKLYVNSGNQCAFPGCTNKIVDEDGVFIAQVCHIEAANEGGERFNPNMTNEERRDYSNLLLLCYEHHQVTNNEEKYTVSDLMEMKDKHENKFKSIIEDMSTSFVGDITKSQSITYPKTLNSMNIELKWRHGEEELETTIEIMSDELNKLTLITPATRSVFLTMLERSDGNIILLDEIQDLLNLTNKKMAKHLDILIKYKLIEEPEEDYDYRGYISEFYQPDGWPMWEDIKVYCEKKQIDLRSMVYEMDFNLLD